MTKLKKFLDNPFYVFGFVIIFVGSIWFVGSRLEQDPRSSKQQSLKMDSVSSTLSQQKKATGVKDTVFTSQARLSDLVEDDNFSTIGKELSYKITFNYNSKETYYYLTTEDYTYVLTGGKKINSLTKFREWYRKYQGKSITVKIFATKWGNDYLIVNSFDILPSKEKIDGE